MKPVSNQTEGIGVVRPLTGNGNGLSRRTICVFLFFLVQVGIVFNLPIVFYNYHTEILVLLVLISGLLIVLASRSFVVSWPLAILVLTEIAYYGIGTLTGLSQEADLPARAWWQIRVSIAVGVIMYGSAVGVPEALRHLGVKTTLTYFFALLLVGISTIFFSDFLYESIESMRLAPRTLVTNFTGSSLGIYRSPGQIVGLSGMLATISLVFLGRRQKEVITNAGFIGLALAVLAIMISASKTGAVIVTILFTTFLFLGNQMRKARMTSLLLCLIVGLTVIIPTGLANRFISVTHFVKFAHIVTFVTGRGIVHSGNAVYSNRNILWSRSFDAFLESPITGHGLSKYTSDPRIADQTKSLRYWEVYEVNPALRFEHARRTLEYSGAHSMFLGLAAEAGIVPASLLILFWLVVAYSALFKMSGPAKELTIGFSITQFCMFVAAEALFIDLANFGCTIGFICGLIKYQRDQSVATRTTRRWSSRKSDSELTSTNRDRMKQATSRSRV